MQGQWQCAAVAVAVAVVEAVAVLEVAEVAVVVVVVVLLVVVVVAAAEVFTNQSSVVPGRATKVVPGSMPVPPKPSLCCFGGFRA